MKDFRIRMKKTLEKNVIKLYCIKTNVLLIFFAWDFMLLLNTENLETVLSMQTVGYLLSVVFTKESSLPPIKLRMFQGEIRRTCNILLTP